MKKFLVFFVFLASSMLIMVSCAEFPKRDIAFENFVKKIYPLFNNGVNKIRFEEEDGESIKMVFLMKNKKDSIYSFAQEVPVKREITDLKELIQLMASPPEGGMIVNGIFSSNKGVEVITYKYTNEIIFKVMNGQVFICNKEGWNDWENFMLDFPTLNDDLRLGRSN